MNVIPALPMPSWTRTGEGPLLDVKQSETLKLDGWETSDRCSNASRSAPVHW